jgi:acyl transferase domain-containing protein/thioesterase domain-containing protein/acyl carrier protein
MKNNAIAIVGMAGRFPGARNVGEFWQNLRDGVESIRMLSDRELLSAGVPAEDLLQPEYVKAAAVLDGVELFDASFFGFSPRDAGILDPQHRYFLECAWEALEDAGHPPESFPGSIGVFAGSGMNAYLIYNLLQNRSLLESAGLFLIRQTGNDKDVLSTRVSYQLNLRGPSISVQTACSTSLVATHLACQSLLNGECDLALAGGVTIEVPHSHGYFYREGEILSRDGHCRAFDRDSSGTVFSSGVGIVVLRRLEEAIQDRDRIDAVILGSAVNNDGSRKIGYLAPSVEGQAEVVAEALGVAGVDAESISYVETHGTGTSVGDPIEIRGLTQAFRRDTARNGFCAIGSLKTNVGHLDTAAGVAGLIKTVLALGHQTLPPSLNFRVPNPLIDFENSPFYVNRTLGRWETKEWPRRAGVTSLGIGGTNAHVILEEAPKIEQPRKEESPQLLVLSAKTETALARATSRLAAHLEQNPHLSLADVAFTSQIGRTPFPYRRAVVASDTTDAARALASGDPARVSTSSLTSLPGSVVFMFSGQGSQYVPMGKEIYKTQRVFREAFEDCAKQYRPLLGLDLLALLFGNEPDAREQLDRTSITQPALFALEYSLARWWMAQGIEPEVMVGHSIGEYAAACIAGVLTLEDAIVITAARGRLMQQAQPGAMLAVPLPPEELPLPPSLSLAAINAPEQTVVSGPLPEIADFERELLERGVSPTRLRTSHAFHSAMMDPILERFRSAWEQIELRPPRIPYVSNLTGTWITAKEATDPEYWTEQLRRTVRFSDCLSNLLTSSESSKERWMIEIGPGRILESLARQQAGKKARVFSSLPRPDEKVSDTTFLFGTLGKLWTIGQAIDWSRLERDRSVRRVSLPTYPFERQRYWVEPDRVSAPAAATRRVATPPEPSRSPRRVGVDEWFYRRTWSRTAPPTVTSFPRSAWLVFLDPVGLGKQIVLQLRGAGHDVMEVSPADSFRRLGRSSYTIRPGVREDYDRLLRELMERKNPPKKIVHAWSVRKDSVELPLDRKLDLSFYSLLFLGQALADQDLDSIDIAVVSDRLHSLSDNSSRDPVGATVLGPVRVIPKELPGITCRNIDVDLKSQGGSQLAVQIIAEHCVPFRDSVVAYRDGQRFVETFEGAELGRRASLDRLKERGVYLITGGLGGLGLTIASYLARTRKARLVLLGRTSFPRAGEWKSALEMPETPDRVKKQLRALVEMESLGAEIVTARADVANQDELKQAVDLALEKFGSINGVIHAAGVLEDGPLQTKARDSAARVLRPKVQGTLALAEVLRDVKLDFLALFSSVSSFAPPAGQVDYAAANAFLDAFARSRRDFPVMAIDWGPWRDLGMASPQISSHPLLGRRLLKTADQIAYAGEFSTDTHWILSEHRLRSGQALFPGTAYLELAAAALTGGSFQQGIELEDVVFLSPLGVESGKPKQVEIDLRRNGNGGFRFSILAKDPAWSEHATGQIARLKRQPPSRESVAEILSRCSSRVIHFDDAHRTKQEKFFDFGSRWRNLKTLHFGEMEAMATLELPKEHSEDALRFQLHPALLDLATGSSLYLIRNYEQSSFAYLPFSYKRASFYQPLPLKFYSHIRSRRSNLSESDVATFDITLLDVAGRVLGEIEEFSLRQIQNPEGAFQDKLDLPASPAELEIGPAAFEDREIAIADGEEAFTRILSSDQQREIIVYPNDLSGLTNVSRPLSKPGKVEASQTDDVESVLRGWWMELLGLEHVGLDDDFFELGGQSLVGVRLFTKIKKSFGVTLGLSTLFEARTIRQLASLVRDSRQREETVPKPWSPIVGIQTKGSRPPLYVISGLGGNVIKFHSLAYYLGEDQPVYGLLPRGLDGHEPFYTRVEEMAAYYVEAIAGRQPEGPYRLVGYSFGGALAFEVAQQLRARGGNVTFVGLFDTIEWEYMERVANALKFHERLSVRLVRLQDEFPEDSRLTSLGRLVSSKCSAWIYRLFHAIGRPVPQTVGGIEDINAFAGAHYKPKPYPGVLTLFRSTSREAIDGDDPFLGWGKFAPLGVEVHPVPSTHFDILQEPGVRVLAEKLRQCLDRDLAREREEEPSRQSQVRL